MPFAIAGAGITAAAGIAGGMMQAGAASKAGEQSQAALQQSRNDLMPWMTTGGLANTAGTDLLGLNGPGAADAAFANYRTSPGYGFQLSEGLRAVDAGAAAKGMLRSGATLKQEQAFGAGLADSDFQQYFKNLMGLSDQGLGAAKAGAGVGEASARNAQATGSAQGSIYGNLATGLGNTANALLGDKDFRSWGKSLFSSPTGTDPINS